MNMQRGSLGLYILLIVIIFIGVFLAGGAFPDSPISPALHPSDNFSSTQLSVTPDQTQYVAVTLVPGPSDKNNQKLQLLTLRWVPKVTSCISDTAVFFVIDVSGSMRLNNKLPSLQSGIRTFMSTFPDSGIIGLEEFSWNVQPDNVKIPLSQYGTVKTTFLNDIASINPNGSTYTRDAFQLALDTLTAGINQFPGKKFNLIFISDGIPEYPPYQIQCTNNDQNTTIYTSAECTSNCTIDPTENKNRCFAPQEDPTGKSSSPALTDIAQQIKDKGVKIFTIAYPDTNLLFVNKQATMMRAIASTEADGTTDYRTVPLDNDLTQIAKQIYSNLCQ